LPSTSPCEVKPLASFFVVLDAVYRCAFLCFFRYFFPYILIASTPAKIGNLSMQRILAFFWFGF